jgi:hypothetical protein
VESECSIPGPCVPPEELSRQLIPSLLSLHSFFNPPSCSVGNGPNGVSNFDVGGAFGSTAPPRDLLQNLTARTCSCSQYASSSCCTLDYMAAVQAGPESIYQGWTYNQCGRTVSSACRAFMNAQECNYGCSSAHSMRYSQGTPIHLCGSFCDAWFDACANELTCSSVWGNSWPLLPGGYVCNTTPMDGFAFQPCKTFRDTFGNAQGMCGGLTTALSPPKAALWGNTYRYDATNNPATW